MSRTAFARRVKIWTATWAAAATFVGGLLAVSPSALAQTTVAGISIPDQVGGMSHQPPTDFESRNPGFGYGLRFPSSTWTIDVYIYDLQMKSIADDPASAAVQGALREAEDEIATIEKRGDYVGVTLKDTFTVRDTAGRARFVCAEYNYFSKRQNADLDSYVCLAGAKGQFVKLRMDTRTSNTGARRTVEGWAHAWIPVLWSS
jgi:hypothetical protein